jgi:hypothetical protein
MCGRNHGPRVSNQIDTSRLYVSTHESGVCMHPGGDACGRALWACKARERTGHAVVDGNSLLEGFILCSQLCLLCSLSLHQCSLQCRSAGAQVRFVSCAPVYISDSLTSAFSHVSHIRELGLTMWNSEHTATRHVTRVSKNSKNHDQLLTS